ncbi:MAG: ATP-binding protein [Gemmatimonadota bacterium]
MRKTLRSTATRITLLYGFFATLWIYLSDRALITFLGDPAAVVRFSLLKGVAFVGVTAILLLVLMRRSFRAIEDGYGSLLAAETQRRAQETERRIAEDLADKERHFSDTVIESLHGIVYLHDRQGRFLRWNQDFERVTKYCSGEIADLHPLMLIRPEDRPVVEERIAEVFATGQGTIEATLIAKDGTATPYFFTEKRIDLDGSPCLLGMGIDISVRTQAEAALRALNESLEMKVADRTEELRSALIRAESADRLKSAFLATMSHELRTPLNSIIGFTGIVLQGLAGPLNTEQKKQLGMVRSSARLLLELISDVLDISKIEAGQMQVQLESVDLAASLDRVIETVRPAADEKVLTLELVLRDGPLEIRTDRRRLEQILLNLLNNAIKFTRQGGVTVSVDNSSEHNATPEAPPGSAVRIRVSDTGIGIKPSDLNMLFLPFQQIDSGLGRQHEGTGLGLAISQRLAELLGGEIVVASEWGQGSAFTIVLPADGALPEGATEQ